MADSRIIELLTDILHELRDMKEEQRGTSVHVDKLEVIVNHQRRLAKVEAVVFI